jgi:hypothetical protein
MAVATADMAEPCMCRGSHSAAVATYLSKQFLQYRA